MDMTRGSMSSESGPTNAASIMENISLKHMLLIYDSSFAIILTILMSIINIPTETTHHPTVSQKV